MINWPPKTITCDITGVEAPNPDYEIALYFCQVGIVKGIDMMSAIQTQDRLDPVRETYQKTLDSPAQQCNNTAGGGRMNNGGIVSDARKRKIDVELLQMQLKTLVGCWEDNRNDWSTVATKGDYNDGCSRVYDICINSLRDGCKSAGMEI